MEKTYWEQLGIYSRNETSIRNHIMLETVISQFWKIEDYSIEKSDYRGDLIIIPTKNNGIVGILLIRSDSPVVIINCLTCLKEENDNTIKDKKLNALIDNAIANLNGGNCQMSLTSSEKKQRIIAAIANVEAYYNQERISNVSEKLLAVYSALKGDSYSPYSCKNVKGLEWILFEDNLNQYIQEALKGKFTC